MDKELIAYFDERFSETAQQITALREETLRRFDQIEARLDSLDEAVRHTRVEIEGLRGEIRLVASFDEVLANFNPTSTARAWGDRGRARNG